MPVRINTSCKGSWIETIETIEITPFEEIKKSVQIDWGYALSVVATLDKYADDENRTPIKDKAAIIILAEYGAITYNAVCLPENTRLLIVISPPFVFFCPSSEGLDGVYIESYSEDKHGKAFMVLEKDNLFAYSNLDARLDGWAFAASMIELAWKR